MRKIDYKKFYEELEQYINEMEDKRNDVKILNFVIERLDLIPREVIKFISDKTGLLERGIERTIEFYPKFRKKYSNLKEINICTGMTCGPKGGIDIYEKLLNQYNVGADGKIADRNVKISQCRCFGRCNKAVNVSIDGEIKSFMTLERIKKYID